MTIDFSRNNGFQVMASAQQLLQSFDALPQPEKFRDYGPNGLQVDNPA